MKVMVVGVVSKCIRCGVEFVPSKKIEPVTLADQLCEECHRDDVRKMLEDYRSRFTDVYKEGGMV